MRSSLTDLAVVSRYGFPVLHAHDKRVDEDVRDLDPLVTAVSKYGIPQGYLDIDMAREVLDKIEGDLNKFSSALAPYRVWTLDEAVNGVRRPDGSIVTHCEGLNMLSAAGYGYPGGPKKNWWTRGSDDMWIVPFEVRKNMEDLESVLSSGIHQSVVWTDCLKDERISLAKMQRGVTRSFCIAPVHYTILVKRYFGDWIADFRRSAPKSFSAIGINVHSWQWTQVWERLLRMSDHGLDLDYKNFDGRAVFAYVVDGLSEIVSRAYMPCSAEDNNVRRLLMYEMPRVYSRCGNILYRRSQGNPSGSPITTEVNTFQAYFLVIYIFCKVSLRLGKEYDVGSFDDYVRVVAYGDDTVISVHPWVQDWFTVQEILYEYEQLGLVVTPAAKSGEFTTYVPLTELTFLKCGYVDGEHRALLPRIEKKTIEEMVLWWKPQAGFNEEEMLRPTVDESLWFAFFWGEEYYTWWANQLFRAMMACGFVFNGKTYESQRRRWNSILFGPEETREHFNPYAQVNWETWMTIRDMARKCPTRYATSHRVRGVNACILCAKADKLMTVSVNNLTEDRFNEVIDSYQLVRVVDQDMMVPWPFKYKDTTLRACAQCGNWIHRHFNIYDECDPPQYALTPRARDYAAFNLELLRWTHADSIYHGEDQAAIDRVDGIIRNEVDESGGIRPYQCFVGSSEPNEDWGASTLG
jgi:hypothetical protein